MNDLLSITGHPGVIMDAIRKLVNTLRPYALLLAAAAVGTPGLIEALRSQAVAPWQHLAILLAFSLATLWTRPQAKAPASFVESVQALDLEPDDADDVLTLVNVAWTDGRERGFAEGLAAKAGASGPTPNVDGSGR